MSATVVPGLCPADPRVALFALWRSPAAVCSFYSAATVVARTPQGAEPDPSIRMDGYVPPVHSVRSNPDALIPKAIDAAAWTTSHKAFPHGAEWEITSANAAAWAAHRFDGHFSERVLRLIVNPEGHPLFELRLDLLQYEVLFARFVGVPHNPNSARQELPPAAWPRSLELSEHRNKPAELAGPVVRCHGVERGDPELQPMALQPQPWTPSCPALLACLQASCLDYATGLAQYLLPGREHWGAD